jgi:hypothetical protein
MGCSRTIFINSLGRAWVWPRRSSTKQFPPSKYVMSRILDVRWLNWLGLLHPGHQPSRISCGAVPTLSDVASYPSSGIYDALAEEWEGSNDRPPLEIRVRVLHHPRPAVALERLPGVERADVAVLQGDCDVDNWSELVDRTPEDVVDWLKQNCASPDESLNDNSVGKILRFSFLTAG